MEKSDLFYCYSPKLKNFLVHKKQLKYLHKGFHDEKEKWFWVFTRNEQLNKCLSEWSLNK